jgi:hypothetical protein
MGHFWAMSMLGVERLHVLIKHLSKGRKNILKSMQKKYNLLCTSQIAWRHDPTHEWSNEGYKSSLSKKKPVVKATNSKNLMGKQTKVKGTDQLYVLNLCITLLPYVSILYTKYTADDELFKQLEDQWAVLNRDFDAFRDKYHTYVKKCEGMC